jgi:hypothetical protein
MEFSKNEKMRFSSYFGGSPKSNSYTLTYFYKAFLKKSHRAVLFSLFNSTGGYIFFQKKNLFCSIAD